jgi:3-hydroxy-3-methylglutaryl CoA synthase
MPGILATSAYVPRWRLPREVIAREWGGMPMGGEKAVANHDEDALSMAVNAALMLDVSGVVPDAVWFASTTPPYLEKQSAATIAAVLDLPGAVRTTDVGTTLRAGTSALLAAVDAVTAGSARRALVTAADCRLGEPESSGEQSWGDAAAALIVGSDAGVAEIVATHTVADDFLGTWRTSSQDFPHGLPGGAFEAKQGYARVLVEAAKGALAAAGVTAAQLATVVLPTPQPRAPLVVAKALGIDPKTQLQDGLWMQLGDTGAAQPLVLLAAALERAKAGDLILLLGYGDGADAFVLRATGASMSGVGVARQIETKRTLPSYGRYARFRRLMRHDGGTADQSSPVILFRDRAELLPLRGGRCGGCGVVQFPRHRVCIECGRTDGLDDVRLAHRGTLFTFTHDHIAESPDPPTTHAVVDLDGGGRLYLQLTDCDAEQIVLDMPLELTFRRLHEGGGFNNYFWKARPA